MTKLSFVTFPLIGESYRILNRKYLSTNSIKQFDSIELLYAEMTHSEQISLKFYTFTYLNVKNKHSRYCGHKGCE